MPAGVDEDSQLRLAGKGEAGINGGPSGDIYIEFQIDKHPLFERDEDDIYLELPVTITELFRYQKRSATYTEQSS